jgi:hypothetical protein
MGRDDTATINAAITIRRMDIADPDRAAVARLAELDTRETLDGPVLGVEVEGSLVAAISLASGAVVADPFSRTAELRTLLELRATQFHRRNGKRERSRRSSRRRSRPAVGGSPPGQIISLPRWG